MKINIRVAKPDKVLGHNVSMFISFNYNEYYISVVKAQPERAYNPQTKEWEVPYIYIDNILKYINSNDDYSINIDKEVEHIVRNGKRKFDISQVEYDYKTAPYQHQIEGINYGLEHDKFLLGDEQGLGKTCQVLNIACIKKKYLNYKHCLVIVCVNTLKYNWQDEVSTHTNEKAYILGTRYNKKGDAYIGSNEDRLDDLIELYENPKSPIHDNYFIITNIETLRYKTTIEVPNRSGRSVKKITKFPIVEQLQELIKNGEINMIIADEIHRCFSGDTLVDTDKGKIRIDDLVNDVSNHVLKIKTYDTVTKSYSYVKPLNYFKNPITETLIELTIMLDNGRTTTIKCTPTHKIYTENRGYVCAKDLTSNDIIKELDKIE